MIRNFSYGIDRDNNSNPTTGHRYSFCSKYIITSFTWHMRSQTLAIMVLFKKSANCYHTFCLKFVSFKFDAVLT